MSNSTPKDDAMTRVMARGKQAEEKLKQQNTSDQSHLSDQKHAQRDFFIADIFDATSFRDDIASMEYPYLH